MSADNFVLVRRCGERYCISSESVSIAGEVDGHIVSRLGHPAPVDAPGVRYFDDKSDAIAAADDWGSEYGIVVKVDEDSSSDTIVNRRAAVAALLGDRFEARGGRWSDPTRVELHIGACTVVITPNVQADDDDPRILASWIEASLPDAFA